MNPSTLDQISRKAVWGLKWMAPVLLLVFFVGLAATPRAAGRHPRKSSKKKDGVPGVQLPPEFTDFLRRGL
jgi:hypothetical protein